MALVVETARSRINLGRGLRLHHSCYAPVRRVEPGEWLRLDEPFGVDIDLAVVAQRPAHRT